MNLLQPVDALLPAEVPSHYWRHWNDVNKAAIEAYNQRIAQEGLPLAPYRGF